MSIEPFNRLVKLAARAFYDNVSTKSENQPKTGRSDNKGIAVVVLDALTRRQWVREEDLAKDLKLHSKQLRRTLRFFEEEKLITRDHRKETAKGAKIYSAAVAATADGTQNGREGDEKVKLHTHSYCCLDYAQIYDVVRYRLYRMRKKLKDELDNKNIVVEYICPKCGKRYNALDASRLVDMTDDNFHCEICNGIIEVDTGKLAAQEAGEGDDNARRRHRDKLEELLKKMEIQLKPLIDQLNRVKDLRVPEFGSLQGWEARASAAARAANGDLDGNDPSKSGQGLGFGGTPMPYVGETKVEVAFSGIEEKGENIKSEGGNAPTKVLPPWMIRQGMVLTKEQRGEVKEEAKMDGSKAPVGAVDDKMSAAEKDDVKNIQDEYVKAYYAALLQRQREQEKSTNREQELANSNTITSDFGVSSSERQVGMKSKREDEDEEDDVEWEDAPSAGNTSKTFKVNDLNIQADDATADDDEDDGIDWEEG